MNVLDRTYAQSRLKAVAQVENRAAALWMAREIKSHDFPSMVVPVVEGGMQLVAGLVSAYFNAKARIFTGDPRLVGITVPAADITISALRGAPAKEVYGRPYGTYWYMVKEGFPLPECESASKDYVVKLATTDMQLAQTNAARIWMAMANG